MNIEPHLQRLRHIAARILGSPIEIELDHMVGLKLHESCAACWTSNLSDDRQSIVIRAQGLPSSVREAHIVLNSLVAHELGHAVLQGQGPTKADFAGLEKIVATHIGEWPAHFGDIPWLGHDARFIRGMIHVGHRLSNQGLSLCMPAAFDHRSYGLSHIDGYVEALGDEPATNDWLPIIEALDRPMPAEFWELWGRDVANSLGLDCSKGANEC